MAEITFNYLSEFLLKAQIKEGRLRDDTDLFKYICYEKIDSIRKIALPQTEIDSEKEAVIVESRISPHFEFILRNTILKLGSSWSHTVVCSDENFSFVRDICVASGAKIRILNLGKWTGNNFCNNLMYDINFWKFFKADFILIYQDDSIIFRKGIDDFIGYDYLGAPWVRGPFGLEFGNGGFSLRNKNLTISILSDTEYVSSILRILTESNRDVCFGLDLPAEDVFYSFAFKHKPTCPANLEVAINFSSETIINHHSLGGHKFWNFDPDWLNRMNSLIDELESS